MTQIKCLYTNGDSFIFGMEAIESGSRDPANKEMAFVKHISDYFGLEYKNHAYNAATNEFIFRRTIFDLEELKKHQDPREILVVIGWTSLFREEILAKHMFDYFLGSEESVSVDPEDLEYHNFGTFFINPQQSQDVVMYKKNYKKTFNISQQATDFCTMYFWDEDFAKQKLESKIIALRSYLELNQFKYLFINTCCDLKEFQLIDKDFKRFYNLTYSFYNWANENYPKRRREKNHFDDVVHKEYAKLLIEYIEKEKILE